MLTLSGRRSWMRRAISRTCGRCSRMIRSRSSAVNRAMRYGFRAAETPRLATFNLAHGASSRDRRRHRLHVGGLSAATQRERISSSAASAPGGSRREIFRYLLAGGDRRKSEARSGAPLPPFHRACAGGFIHPGEDHFSRVQTPGAGPTARARSGGSHGGRHRQVDIHVIVSDASMPGQLTADRVQVVGGQARACR